MQYEESKRAPAEERETLLQAQEVEDDVAFNEQIVQERNREIREIETAVVEVGEIFQDLAAMVNEQGVMVDVRNLIYCLLKCCYLIV